ncbi:MAG: PhzF family phenazine biosynthesis protein [Acidobacteriota bacterium]
MKLPIFQLDAFASRQFGGNPAAVVVLPKWLPDETLQSIAQENNLAETAFVVPGKHAFDLRWFTPEVEMDLCGHATLASAHVMFNHGYTTESEIVFRYQGGTLAVTRQQDLLAMDFPARPPTEIECDASVAKALGASPSELHQSRDLLAVFDSQADVEKLRPDFAAVAKLDTFAVIASAPGQKCDFVSRFFAPGAGIAEDPATGSSHCTLVPYWSDRLGKSKLHALQLSRREGEFFCESQGKRIKIAGRVLEYLQGEIYV